MGKNYKGGDLSVNANTQHSAAFGLGVDSIKVALVVQRTAGAGAVDAELQGTINGENWANVGSSVAGAADAPAAGAGVDDIWPKYRVQVSSVGQADVSWRVVAIG